jgi:hypothetical protein
VAQNSQPTTRAQIDTKLKAFAESGIGDVKALRVPPRRYL